MGPSSFNFFGPSCGFDPFVKLVSGVLRKTKLGAGGRRVLRLGLSKVYARVIVGNQPWFSAC